MAEATESGGKRAVVKKAKKTRPVAYTCKTCGRVAKTRSHLCSPEKTDELYICAYCGRSSGDPYHVCAPMVGEMRYVCKNCGRVTPFRGAVCQPKPIR
jgi:predicted RNA-binding Zn-ribbon protein involved in translation (DUF1610 family)